MADFKISVNKTLIHEGGYTNNLNDSGGPTNMGVTQADMPGVDIQTLTPAQAIEYYQQNYWKPLFSQINDQFVADKIFDMSVLFGVGTAVKIMQTIFSIPGVVTDGIFGPHTLDLVNTAEPVGLLAAYKSDLVKHAVAIVAANLNDRVFFSGWVRRINS
jgi:lysozyme family protein